jgi:hypothetical protein
MNLKKIENDLNAEIARVMAEKNFIPEVYLPDSNPEGKYVKEANELEKAIFTVSFRDSNRKECCLSREKEGTKEFENLKRIFLERERISTELLRESIIKHLREEQKEKSFLLSFWKGWKIYIIEVEIINLLNDLIGPN